MPPTHPTYSPWLPEQTAKIDLPRIQKLGTSLISISTSRHGVQIWAEKLTLWGSDVNIFQEPYDRALRKIFLLASFSNQCRFSACKSCILVCIEMRVSCVLTFWCLRSKCWVEVKCFIWYNGRLEGRVNSPVFQIVPIDVGEKLVAFQVLNSFWPWNLGPDF